MPVTGAGAPDPDSPELAAALEEFIRDYETSWLDQPIPALDGHTPRQAADDPTRRADLIKLLDTFPPARAPVAGWTPTGCAPLWACSSRAGGTHGGIAAPISAANSRKCGWPAAATSDTTKPAAATGSSERK